MFKRTRDIHSRQNVLSCSNNGTCTISGLALNSKQSVRRMCNSYLKIETGTTDGRRCDEIAVWGILDEFWKGGKYSPARLDPAPAMIRNKGVFAVARLNGGRPVVIQGSDDILRGAGCGAQMLAVAGLIR